MLGRHFHQRLGRHTIEGTFAKAAYDDSDFSFIRHIQFLLESGEATTSGRVFAIKANASVLHDPLAQTPLQKIDARRAGKFLGQRHQQIHEFLRQLTGLDRVVGDARDDGIDLSGIANFRHNLAAPRPALSARRYGPSKCACVGAGRVERQRPGAIAVVAKYLQWLGLHWVERTPDQAAILQTKAMDRSIGLAQACGKPDSRQTGGKKLDAMSDRIHPTGSTLSIDKGSTP
jgi:hypothetical protein